MPLFPTRQALSFPWLRALADEGSIQVCDPHGETVMLIPNDAGTPGHRIARVVEDATTLLANIRSTTAMDAYAELLKIAALSVCWATIMTSILVGVML